MKLIRSTVVHKQMYWIQTNLQRFQPSNVKCDIRMVVLHYIMEYVGNLCSPCAVLVHYMSNQKGEFMFLGTVHVCLTALVEENILLVTVVHKLSLTVNIYD